MQKLSDFVLEISGLNDHKKSSWIWISRHFFNFVYKQSISCQPYQKAREIQNEIIRICSFFHEKSNRRKIWEKLTLWSVYKKSINFIWTDGQFSDLSFLTETTKSWFGMLCIVTICPVPFNSWAFVGTKISFSDSKLFSEKIRIVFDVSKVTIHL